MEDMPHTLARGDELPASWLNRILACLRSRELRAGPGIRLTRTPSGTTVSAAAATGGREAPPRPFDVRLVADTSEGAAAGARKAQVYLPAAAAEGAVRLNGLAVEFGGTAPARTGQEWMDVPAASGPAAVPEGSDWTVWIAFTPADGAVASLPAAVADERAGNLRWLVVFNQGFLAPLPTGHLAHWNRLLRNVPVAVYDATAKRLRQLHSGVVEASAEVPDSAFGPNLSVAWRERGRTPFGDGRSYAPNSGFVQLFNFNGDQDACVPSGANLYQGALADGKIDILVRARTGNTDYRVLDYMPLSALADALYADLLSRLGASELHTETITYPSSPDGPMASKGVVTWSPTA